MEVDLGLASIARLSLLSSTLSLSFLELWLGWLSRIFFTFSHSYTLGVLSIYLILMTFYIILVITVGYSINCCQ